MAVKKQHEEPLFHARPYRVIVCTDCMATGQPALEAIDAALIACCYVPRTAEDSAFEADREAVVAASPLDPAEVAIPAVSVAIGMRSGVIICPGRLARGRRRVLKRGVQKKNLELVA